MENVMNENAKVADRRFQADQDQPAEHPRVGMKMKEDPWAHRSAGMKCASCMWFVIKSAADRLTMIGRCRRHAPTMNGYPAVFMHDWCGDHKIDENKV